MGFSGDCFVLASSLEMVFLFNCSTAAVVRTFDLWREGSRPPPYGYVLPVQYLVRYRSAEMRLFLFARIRDVSRLLYGVGAALLPSYGVPAMVVACGLRLLLCCYRALCSPEAAAPALGPL